MTEFDCSDCFVKKAYERKEELREKFSGLFGGETFDHLRNAHREMLLAVKSLVDQALEEKPKAKTKARKVRID